MYYRYQQQYIRKRLDAIKLLKQGNSRFQVCQEVGCSYDTLTSWIDKYLSEGLKGLVTVITHHKPGRLNREQQQQIKAMVLYVELGVSKLCIIVDNNPTHKQKMRVQLATHLQQMGLAQEITVEFLYVPPYSPKLNLVEYVIHLLRLRFLHHLPLGTTLVEIEQQLEQFLQSHQFLGSQQVRKTLNFIFSLVA